MIVKDKFILLKDTPNTVNISNSLIKNYEIENGINKFFVIVKLVENRIKHFTKTKIIELVNNKDKRDIIDVVNIKNYLLPVTYNKTNNKILINIISIGSNDISKIDTRDIYASLVYGLMFKNLTTSNINIKTDYYKDISIFFVSILIRLFGKQYGLLGVYSNRIKKLHFLLSCYVLNSFFDISGSDMLKRSSLVSSFPYKEIEDNISKFDFSKIDDFIKSLSYFEIMPNINQYIFANRIFSKFGYNFLPAFEDFSRFLSIILTSSLSGCTIVPTFVGKYNTGAYNKILNLCENIYNKIEL